MSGAPSRDDDARPLRVALDVRMPAAQWGGVQQLAQGLGAGLSGLGGPDEYLFLGFADAATWLDPVLSGPCRRIEVPRSHGRTSARRMYDTLSARAPRLARLVGRAAGGLRQGATGLPRSDGFLESLGVDVVHFVTPQAYLTSVPSLYQPLDLLHVHVPDQFTTLHREYRDRAYRTFCEQAACVVAMTDWGRRDLAGHFGLDPARIAVVPVPPVVLPTAALSTGVDAAGANDTGRFLLFPAQTWPHKNHLGLVDAVAVLRARGIDVRVTCTGRLTDHHRVIDQRARVRGVSDLVTFLGYVDDAVLGDLYRRAVGLVFPSRFEGWGLPVVEAFASGIPVACSDIPVLREVAGDAALLFAPDDPVSIADALSRIWTDGNLRRSLVDAGRERVQDLTWDRTARTYRALYRRIAGQALAAEDRDLLEPPTVAA